MAAAGRSEDALDMGQRPAAPPGAGGPVCRVTAHDAQIPGPRRGPPHLLVMLGSLSLVWVPIAAMLFFRPPSFTSEWTLIMPGAGGGHAVNLDSIGQATANIASPFTNSSVDPLVNYREIATSTPVLTKAAAQVGIPVREFGKPRIKLVEQTTLMQFQVKGPTAEQARANSLALYHALQAQLEVLRSDEVARVTQSRLATIDNFGQKLEQTQLEKLDYQNRNDILTVEQFAQLVTRMEDEHADIARQTALHASIQGQVNQLLDSTNLQRDELRHALTLRNDPLFQAQLRRYAAVQAQDDTINGVWGRGHPQLSQLRATHDSLNNALTTRGRSLTGRAEFSTARLIDLGSNEIETDLLQTMVQLMAQEAGLSRELAQRNQILSTLRRRIANNAADAIRLEDLSRKQQVATAVFSTALAKQDIGKVDRFASYPLIQILAEPTRPEGPDKMHVKLAVLGGTAATLLILSGLLLSWSRKPLLQKMLRSGSSGSP